MPRAICAPLSSRKPICLEMTLEHYRGEREPEQCLPTSIIEPDSSITSAETLDGWKPSAFSVPISRVRSEKLCTRLLPVTSSIGDEHSAEDGDTR